MVIKKALEKDTPQRCAVVTGGLAGIGAIIGHATTEDAVGTLIGATAGLNISYFSYSYFNRSHKSPEVTNIIHNNWKRFTD